LLSKIVSQRTGHSLLEHEGPVRWRRGCQPIRPSTHYARITRLVILNESLGATSSVADNGYGYTKGAEDGTEKANCNRAEEFIDARYRKTM
jgi:hypothetical protein